MDTEVKSEMQLQLWNPALKRYTVEANMADVLRGTDAARGHARSQANGWRICRADRPLKPKYIGPRSTAGRPVEDIQRDYMRWARDANLTAVTMYESRPAPNFEKKDAGGWQYHRRGPRTWITAVPIFTGDIRYISVDQQFAVTAEDDVP